MKAVVAGMLLLGSLSSQARELYHCDLSGNFTYKMETKLLAPKSFTLGIEASRSRGEITGVSIRDKGFGKLRFVSEPYYETASVDYSLGSSLELKLLDDDDYPGLLIEVSLSSSYVQDDLKKAGYDGPQFWMSRKDIWDSYSLYATLHKSPKSMYASFKDGHDFINRFEDGTSVKVHYDVDCKTLADLPNEEFDTIEDLHASLEKARIEKERLAQEEYARLKEIEERGEFLRIGLDRVFGDKKHSDFKCTEKFAKDFNDFIVTTEESPLTYPEVKSIYNNYLAGKGADRFQRSSCQKMLTWNNAGYRQD